MARKGGNRHCGELNSAPPHRRPACCVGYRSAMNHVMSPCLIVSSYICITKKVAIDMYY